MKTRIQRAVAAVTAGATAMSLGGCGVLKQPSEVVLPGKGTGAGSYTLNVQFENIANLIPNAEVKLNDVTIGTVKSIRLNGWQPTVEVGIEQDVLLPANTTASIGQKSLLGAQYLELAVPSSPTSVPPLRDGSVIAMDHTSKYPETEQVLGALSIWLNGGAVEHLRTIASELNKGLAGNGPAMREIVNQLGDFVGTLDAQRAQITALLDQLGNFGTAISAQREDLAVAVDKIEPGLAVLNRQRSQLLSALGSTASFADIGSQVITAAHENLVSVLSDLKPLLDSLVTSAPDVPNALSLLLTFLFPVDVVHRVIKGDYLSVNTTLNLAAHDLSQGLWKDRKRYRAKDFGLQQFPEDPLLAPIAPPDSAGPTSAPPDGTASDAPTHPVSTPAPSAPQDVPPPVPLPGS